MKTKHLIQFDNCLGDLRDAQSRLETSYSEGETEGMKKGLAKGKAEGKAELIKSMHNSGLSLEMICQVSKLTQDQVQKIIDND